LVKRSFALGLGIGALALAACQVIAGIERIEKVDATDVPDANGSSGNSSSGISKNDPCGHIIPPDVPDKNDPGDDVPPFVLAASKLHLTQPSANGLAGFDLDLSCTCDPRPGTNQDGGSSCKPRGSNAVLCDVDGGVDNQALNLFTQFNQYEDLDKGFADDAQAGKRTILVYIKNWNGKPNDLEVGAGVFVSFGANPFESGKPSAPPPIDQGQSDWSYPSEFKMKDGVLQPTSPLPGGYVRDGRLVIKGAGTITLLLGSTGLTFNEALVVGDLARDPSGLVKFTGVIGGRVRDTDLLSAAGQLKISGKYPACEYLDGVPFNTLIKPAICQATDLAQGQRSDFKDSECDSISSAIGIEAYSAKISGDAPVDVPTEDIQNPCTPAAKGADYYKCP
jgi:hypothetical protein